MKHKWCPNSGHAQKVAPLAGAWIETAAASPFVILSTASPPSRGRGLKPVVHGLISQENGVAPLAGAWIETKRFSR